MTLTALAGTCRPRRDDSVDRRRNNWVNTVERFAITGRGRTGRAPDGFIEFHRISHVQALTLGYVHDVVERSWSRIGIGADATVYRVPANMVDSYGSPHSFHVFVRVRPNAATSMAHVH